MLIRDIKRLALFVGPFIAFLVIAFRLWDPATSEQFRSHASSFLGRYGAAFQDDAQAPLDEPPPPPPPAVPSKADSSGSWAKYLFGEPKLELPAGDDDDNATHHVLHSLSTLDKKYFAVKFGDEAAFNPNILPHPKHDDTYVIVAQKIKTPDDPLGAFYEIACEATFENGVLQCLDVATRLPISSTKTADATTCKGDLLKLLLMNDGPHDARVLMGPKNPYIIYGSNSAFTCFGMWLQDFRAVWNWDTKKLGKEEFALPTELQRPAPWASIEKNWFVFWDKDGQAYTHYDAVPSRTFAKLNPDGSVGPSLGPFAAEQDEKCLTHYLPKLLKNEDIHQATNSLRVTMCKRADKGCKADESNTFIFTIIQQKRWYSLHGEYEPYAMVFRERTPFEVFAISKKPLWISGRQLRDDNTTDMLYVAGMNWKKRGLNYHGFLDDELFLTFGIDDMRSGGIDILASDLLGGLGLCSGI